MAGRTTSKHLRVYVNGYDLSGYSRSVGDVGIEMDTPELTVWTDAVKGYLTGAAALAFGPLNVNMDNTASVGAHVLENTSDAYRLVTLAIGDRAAPVAGNPVFCAELRKTAYTALDSSGAVLANLAFAQAADVTSTARQYTNPFGVLLNANTARTGVNSSSGFGHNASGATAAGGVFVYQVTAGNGTATLSVDDSANNSAFTALSGATSGSITCAAGVYGVVPLSRTATVREYLRWQITLGTATSVTFVSAFLRAYA